MSNQIIEARKAAIQSVLSQLLSTNKPYPDGGMMQKLHQAGWGLGLEKSEFQVDVANQLAAKFPRALSKNRPGQIWAFGNVSKRLRTNGATGHWWNLTGAFAPVLKSNGWVDTTDSKVSGKRTAFIDR